MSTITKGWYNFLIRNNLLELISDNIERIYESSDIIFPPKEKVLNAFYFSKYKHIKCVILGMDPYINEKNNIPEAMGLAFSVDPQIKVLPPSLKNIFKNLLKFNHIKEEPKNGDLTRWSKQGILLLNSSLTTIKNRTGSHMNIWTPITDSIIQELSNEKEKIVFILLGKYAIDKEKLINKNRNHKIIKATHPSPFSCDRKSKDADAFSDKDCFGECNEFLQNNNFSMIEW